MFDSILNAAFSIILGLFLIAMLWSVAGETIKDFVEDIIGMFKKKKVTCPCARYECACDCLSPDCKCICKK